MLTREQLIRARELAHEYVRLAVGITKKAERQKALENAFELENILGQLDLFEDTEKN